MDKDAGKAIEDRRTDDRREGQDPAYTGEERRKADRRQPKPPATA